MNWLGNRLREPSTWVGAGTALSGLSLAAADVASNIETGIPWYVALVIAFGGFVGALAKDPNNGRDSTS